MMTEQPETDLPLLGLLNDVLLPGETRTFRAPVVDAGSLRRLTEAPPERLAALCITLPAELPALAAARWATLARVLQVNTEELTLLGECRQRITKATGGQSPYRAQLLQQERMVESTTDSVLTEAHRLLAALDRGAPLPAEAEPGALDAALLALGRACMTQAQLRDSCNLPLHEILRKQAQRLTLDQAIGEHSCELERQLEQLAGEPTLSDDQRQQIWSQVIAVQRRLDVYEPGVSDTDVEEIGHLQRRLQQAGLPKAARVAAKRELRMLRGMKTSDHDYSPRLGHLEFMAELPWCSEPPPQLSVARLRQQLDTDHFGLDEAKRRIVEYFAVRALGGRAAGTVLCLAGPPGVGKTSLARSIAHALERPLARVALGGVHDECEIRGHRLSFIAAAPGRILRGVADVGSMACVMLLDELDKVSYHEGRSPGAALLEVLDPEQNHVFRDNYLGVPYDLSQVLFICTANDVSAISGPLRDRLEIIDLSGYALAEKLAISKRHLLSRMAKDCGLSTTPALDDSTLERLIEGYTREAGVRDLGRKLSALFRSRAVVQLESRERATVATVALSPDAPLAPDKPLTWDEARAVLGPERYRRRARPDTLPVGVATGLSVDASGGATLYVEVGVMPGSGELRSTGRLGEVMRESVNAALAHIKIDPERYGIARRRLSDDLHLHVPEGAIAKDGPSAGIAIFAALLSALRDEPLPADLAMTGEITLTGDVLPVGAVRAKLLAAERAGLRRVLIPADNRADVPSDLSLEVISIDRIDQALPHLLSRSLRPAASAEHESVSTSPT
jgi:ATP-dependent Lon protease